MRKNERVSQILERVTGQGSVDIPALAEELGVSTATIRRDLQVLEEQHLLRRTRGGAMPGGLSLELPLRYRSGRQTEEKRRIAGTAAGLVPTDRAQVIGLTGGTTTTEVARQLAEHDRLTVVTNALNIAAELAMRSDLQLVVTGGVARNRSYELIGPVAETALARYNLDIAFIGVDGINVAAGCTTHDDTEAYTNRALVSRARTVVVVADGSKLGRAAFAQMCSLAEVDELITDSAADPEAVAEITAAGVEVRQV